QTWRSLWVIRRVSYREGQCGHKAERMPDGLLIPADIDQNFEDARPLGRRERGKAVRQIEAFGNHRQHADAAGRERFERAVERAAPRSDDGHFVDHDWSPWHPLRAGDRRLED